MAAKIGINGFGRIGRRVGELAHAFKMNILANDIYEDNPPSYREFSWVTLEEIFKFSEHSTVTAADRRDGPPAQLVQGLLEHDEITVCGLRRRIAPIGNHVHDRFDVCLAQQLKNAEKMFYVRVDAAIGHHAHQMEAPAVLEHVMPDGVCFQ